ncbi:hypothetical protein BD289DRAFT_180248 [Coniella lustricola]|uniref:Uncharacterized protein n=1 Tax=Coniella lustricola TaxID=2025994 RepID=A0A2T2ZTF5_9PEZI|nr:hypothetical protein BD289DRAFT_180248 [Coniella lustricola]
MSGWVGKVKGRRLWSVACGLWFRVSFFLFLVSCFLSLVSCLFSLCMLFYLFMLVLVLVLDSCTCEMVEEGACMCCSVFDTGYRPSPNCKHLQRTNGDDETLTDN